MTGQPNARSRPTRAARRQMLAAGPDERRRDREASGLPLAGQEREHRRVARHERGVPLGQRGDERGQGLDDREAAPRRPRDAARGVLPRGDAGVVIAGRDDQCGAGAFREGAARAVDRGARRGNFCRKQRVVGPERGVVLDEDRGHAGAAGALPERVAAEVTLADPGAVGKEFVHAGAGHGAIRDPIVEVAHQLALVDDRQVGGNDIALRNAAIGFAIERRMLARVTNEGGEARPPRRFDRAASALSRPDDLGQPGASLPAVERAVKEVPDDRDGTVGHRNVSAEATAPPRSI